MGSPTVSFEMPPDRLERLFGITVVVAFLAMTGYWVMNLIEVLQKYQAVPWGTVSNFW